MEREGVGKLGLWVYIFYIIMFIPNFILEYKNSFDGAMLGCG